VGRLGDRPVVEQRVEVVGEVTGSAVVVHAIGGGLFAEVGLDGGGAELVEVPEMALVDGDALGVGEVDAPDAPGEARRVAQPDVVEATVGVADEPADGVELVEERRPLRDVGELPQRHLDAELAHLGQERGGVREPLGVELEVAAPVLGVPVGVEVEDVDREALVAVPADHVERFGG
jgi:hypothetical protein